MNTIFCVLRRVCFTCLFFQIAHRATAVPAIGPSVNICDVAAKRAARKHSQPLNILLGITRTETGRSVSGTLSPWHWAMSASGNGHWFGGRGKAPKVLRSYLGTQGQNIDIRCFQLDFRWHAENFASMEDKFHPLGKASFPARRLKEMYAKTRGRLSALAAYHSRTPEFASRYLDRFMTILAGLSDHRTMPSSGLLFTRSFVAQDLGGSRSPRSLMLLGVAGANAPLIEIR